MPSSAFKIVRSQLPKYLNLNSKYFVHIHGAKISYALRFNPSQLQNLTLDACVFS